MSVFRPFKAAVLRAELPKKLRLHDLRHTFAGLFLASGGDIFKLSKIVSEEALAWRLGRELLVSLGGFDAREQHGLHIYRYRLGVNLWPCDDVKGFCTIVHRP